MSFHIPGNKKMGVGFIIFGTIFLGAVGFLSFLLPEFSWKEVLTLFLAFFPVTGIGLFGLGAGIAEIFGMTVLDLTPEWLQKSRECFGRCFYSRRIPTNQILKISQQHRDPDGRPEPITLLVGTKTMRLCSGGTDAENDWLAQEIRDYISTF